MKSGEKGAEVRFFSSGHPNVNVKSESFGCQSPRTRGSKEQFWSRLYERGITKKGPHVRTKVPRRPAAGLLGNQKSHSQQSIGRGKKRVTGGGKGENPWKK